MKNKSSSINLNEFHNFIFHFLFFFILSAQIFFTHNYLNSLYVLGIILFIRADYEYNWKLILIISIYGLYQDALLGFQFGFSSMFFLFFFFLGQISNLVSGIGSFLISVYFLAFGILLLSVFEGFYIYFNHNILIDLNKILINIIFLIFLYFFLKKILKSKLLLNA
tara:strand:- start:68 stop:565 length:498 start_codon:yes stop_codon:yes gene_type:complete